MRARAPGSNETAPLEKYTCPIYVRQNCSGMQMESPLFRERNTTVRSRGSRSIVSTAKDQREWNRVVKTPISLVALVSMALAGGFVQAADNVEVIIKFEGNKGPGGHLSNGLELAAQLAK